MTPILSILTPVLLRRDEVFLDKMAAFLRGVEGNFKWYTLLNDGWKSIGEYRQELLGMATGDFCWFVDVDDRLAPDAIPRILHCIENNHPDAIGICVDRFVDGKFVGQATHSNKFASDSHRFDGPGRYIFDKVINHICPIKTEIARSIGFKPLRIGEDTDFGRRLKKSGLLKNVVELGPPAIYFYDYLSKERPA